MIERDEIAITGGGMLFGPLGTILGGRTKEKTTSSAEYYFIITYVDDEIKYVSFQTDDVLKASKYVKALLKPILQRDVG